ncbi:MAG: hypothetical protein LUF02_02050 [Erysipelotrichaceae bacterium]|nr:hypothetical protein [Erysipelotrichaceae bacterium]
MQYQEDILKEIATDNNMHIIGISSIISEDNNKNLYQIEAMNHAIKTGRADVVLVYTEERISTNKNVLDEFMIFCDKYDVEIMTYHQLKDNLLLEKFIDIFFRTSLRFFLLEDHQFSFQRN